MNTTYPYSATYGILEELRTKDRVNSLARINNEQARKESPAMYTPLYVLDAHVQAVNTNRLQQARRAELIRLMRAGQQSPLQRVVTNIRQSTGSMLVSIGQRLQTTTVESAAQRLDAMTVTRAQTSSS